MRRENDSARLSGSPVLLLSSLIWMTSLLLPLPNSGAQAQCVPAAGPGTPLAGTTVTCTGAVTQNAPNGYGDGSQTGLTINVQPGATVSGDTGLVLDTNNTINNLGTVQGGLQFGINSTGNASVVNSGNITGTGDGVIAGGTVTVTNNAGGTIHGSILDGISAATVNGTNAGTISGSHNGINATTVTFTNSNAISGSMSGIIATGAANVTNNGGTIQGTGSGLFGISAGTDVTVVNSGNISGDGIGIKAGQSATVTNNGGAILGTGLAGQFGISAGTNAVVVNSGNITGTGDGITAGGTVTVTNNAGGTIHGNLHNGISGATVNGTNAGTISGPDNGINATTVTITNSNTISGLLNGIIATGAANVTNNGGTIQGFGGLSSQFGISAGTDVTVVNSGNIIGDRIGITAAQSANVTNNGGHISGTGSAGQFGVSAGTNAVVVNSGNITGTGDGITAGGTVTVTNNAGGTIHGNLHNGISGATVNGTNAGTISGVDDGIVASGAGSNIFNTGTIAGTSGTAVQFAGANNILTLGPGSSINGLVTGGSANIFQLGGTGSDTFNVSLIGAAQQYRNFSTFNKIGTSTWTLTGTFGQASPWTVQGGTLSVNGDLSAASGLTVSTGGTLGGTGVLPSTVIASGGTLAPGNSIGTITVNGNLTFNSGSTYFVEVSPSAADRTNVSGTASLTGTVSAVFGPGSYVARSYTILSAAGGLAGTFGALTTNNPNFSTSLSYTSTDVLLNLIAGLGAQQALSGNQQNSAGAINGFANGGGTLPSAFNTLFGLTGSNLAGALSQLSGEAGTGAQRGAFQLISQFLDIMLDPFVYGSGAVSGGPPLGFASEREAPAGDVALAYAKAMKAPVHKAVPLLFEQRWTVWAGGYGGYSHTNGDPAGVGSHDLTARTGGGAVGVDYHFSPDTVAGVALAGGGTNWDLTQGFGGGRSNAFQAGAYAATRSGPWYLAGALAFTNHWISTDRFAALGDHLTADFNAQSFGGRAEAGYRFATPIGGVIPYAALQAQSFHTPAYSETDVTGGGFALNYNSHTGTDTRTELGARFDHVAVVSRDATLTLRGRLAWAHDWITDPTLVPVFQVLPGASFIVNGAAPAENSALVSAGAELLLDNGVTLLCKFNGEFANHSQTYAGTGTLRYRW